MVLLLAGFALILALMLSLVLLAAIGLGPGGSRSLGPLPTPPHYEAAVGDGVGLGGGPTLAVGAARTAPSGPGVASGRVATDGGGVGTGGTSPALAVSPAQAVKVATSLPVSTPPAPEPAEAQPVAAVPEPVGSPPSAVTTPPVGGTGNPAGPISAGVVPPEEPAPACEGTEYSVTVAFDVEAIVGGAEDAEITMRRVGSDGSEVELQLQGGIADLRALLAQFAAEGPCVSVTIEPLGDDDDGAEAEAPEAGSTAPEAPALAEPEPEAEPATP